MRLVRHLEDMPFDDLRSGSIVTVGAYDGLHLGHQQLLERVHAAASASGSPSVVMSFEPMPKEFFGGEQAPARLMRFREKFDSLAAYGIDIFFCPRFDQQMREISADDFVRRILIHGLVARRLVVGDDFCYARRREGTIMHLQRTSRTLGFTVEQVPSIIVDGVRVSSTAIREALWCGDLQGATALLGRPYRMSGRVVPGERVGRSLGYPTANVDLRRKKSPVMGIFAARVEGLPGGTRDAVASVGSRPTFDGAKPILEVHIFDFDEDIYGRYIHVDFVARLRGQQKYERVEDLVAQMHRDAENARSALAADAA